MNLIAHVEIPVSDLGRAMRFYASVFGVAFGEVATLHGSRMAHFPFEEGRDGASGALAEGDVYVPTLHGAIIYLNVADLDAVIARASAKAAKSSSEDAAWRRRVHRRDQGQRRQSYRPAERLRRAAVEVLQTERRRLNGQERRPARNAARPALPAIRGRRCSAVRGRGSGRYAAPASSAEAGVRARAAGAPAPAPGPGSRAGGGTDGDRRPVQRTQASAYRSAAGDNGAPSSSSGAA